MFIIISILVLGVHATLFPLYIYRMFYIKNLELLAKINVIQNNEKVSARNDVTLQSSQKKLYTEIEQLKVENQQRAEKYRHDLTLRDSLNERLRQEISNLTIQVRQVRLSAIEIKNSVGVTKTELANCKSELSSLKTKVSNQLTK